MTDAELKAALQQKVLEHVTFDGWSDACLAAAAADCDIPVGRARALFPRGGIDLAMAFHLDGDARMTARLAQTALDEMRIRDRVAHAVKTRIECVSGEKEAVRRAATLFALPQNSLLGGQLIWGTADAIWTALGDPSDDMNWYTKRMILSGVYASVVLIWLGDESDGNAPTWDFLERRIDDVMGFEKAKSALRKLPMATQFENALNHWVQKAHARPDRFRSMPGSVGRQG